MHIYMYCRAYTTVAFSIRTSPACSWFTDLKYLSTWSKTSFLIYWEVIFLANHNTYRYSLYLTSVKCLSMYVLHLLLSTITRLMLLAYTKVLNHHEMGVHLSNNCYIVLLQVFEWLDMLSSTYWPCIIIQWNRIYSEHGETRSLRPVTNWGCLENDCHHFFFYFDNTNVPD